MPSRPDAVHRPVPRPPRRHPDRRARQDGRRLPHALAAAPARCRRSATGSGPAATTPTTTASGTSATPTSPIRTPARPLATNDDDGEVDPPPSQAYLDADPLDPYGFSGWVGPEPHGAALANSGLRRDPLIADRVVAWLEDRYARRRAGDADALRPFLLVASFVNPHDIVLFPAVAADQSPIEPVAARPAAGPRSARPRDEDLRDQAGRPDRLPGRVPVGLRPGAGHRPHLRAQRAGLPRPLLPAPRRGRRAARPGAPGGHRGRLRPTPCSCARADHGELLGAHGGLHQKWFNLYDEATRVPFAIARVGEPDDRRRHRVDGCRPRTSTSSPRCWPPPGIDADGRSPPSCADDVQRGPPAARPRPDAGRRRPGGRRRPPSRAVYLHDPGQHARGRHRRLRAWPGVSAARPHPPTPLRIQVPAHVGANFEGIVVRVAEADAPEGPATSGSWCAPSTTRPPGPSPGSATWPPTARAGRQLPHRAPPRPVGALRPRRRPDRGRQPGRRPDRRRCRSPCCAGA